MLKYINGIKVPSQLEHLCMCSVNERKTGGEDPLYENMIKITSLSFPEGIASDIKWEKPLGKNKGALLS